MATGEEYYRISQYNVTESARDGGLLVMNMRTERCVKLTGDTAAWFQSQKAGEKFRLDEDARERRLLNGGFLIPDQFDEARWVILKHRETLYGADVLATTIMPTNDCNFRCQYCYQTPNPRYMDAETERRVIRFFERKVSGRRFVKVSWFGGEPLLDREQTCRMASAIHETCKKHCVPLVSTINTNGYNLDVKTFQRLLLSRVLEYEICLDGPAETHNKMRPHKDDPDSFSTVLNNLIAIRRAVKSAAFEITIRCNVASLTIAHLDEYLALLAKYFAHDSRFRVYFQGVRNWGGERVRAQDIPDSESEISKVWYDKAVRYGLKSAEAFSLTPFSGYCEANRRNGYIINYDGTLHKCAIAMYSPHADIDQIGYIDRYGREILDEGKLAQWLVEDASPSDSCKKCAMFPICVGSSCPFRANIEHVRKCNHLEEVARAKLRCKDYLDLFKGEDVV